MWELAVLNRDMMQKSNKNGEQSYSIDALVLRLRWGYIGES